MSECSELQCRETVAARGLCNVHYKQRARSGEDLPPKLDLREAGIERFWSKVEKTSTCWLWRGSMTVYGYGQITINRKNIRAHRLSWELLRGQIPDGMVLDHLCRVRHCVNPEHLEVVTSTTNVLRGIGRSAINARKTVCKRGHPLPASRRCPICRAAVNRRSLDKQQAQRAAVRCGVKTRDGFPCRRKITKHSRCREHGTKYEQAPVVWSPEAQ